MRENIDHTFAKSRVLVAESHWRHGHTHRDELSEDGVILNDQSIDLLAISRNVFGNLRTSSEIVGHLRILSVPYEKS